MIEPLIPARPVILEVAPSSQTTPVLQRLEPSRLIGIDFDPAADGRRVDLQASLTQLPLPAGTVDLLLCFHVLEHVPDDVAAMREVARVLTPNGVGVIQVPWRRSARTDEDPSASTEERVRRFGQHDHVRYYGSDFEERLSAADLAVTRTESTALLGVALTEWLRIPHQDPIWIVSKAHGPTRALNELTDLALALDRFARHLGQGEGTKASTAEIARIRTEIDYLRSTNEVLRRRIRRLKRARETKPESGVTGISALGARLKRGSRKLPPNQ